jgi:hypothetical protein
MRRLRALAACAALLPAAAGADPAPPELRGALVLEPPRLVLGQTARAELVVSTPPGWRVRPPRLPELPGLWVLAIESLPVEREPERWRHRTQVRLRARELGAFAWPALRLELEDPGAGVHELALEARPFEVVSVRPEFPERDAPFGLDAPAGPPAGATGWLAPAAAGAAAALAAVAAVAILRRRAERRSPAAAAPSAPPVWEEALASLAEAGRTAALDPRAAADRGAVALRRYAAGRFGADAQVRTAEELLVQLPPWGARSLWTDFAALVLRLDDARFRPRAPDPEELRAALRDAERFVRDTRPLEAQR